MKAGSLLRALVSLLAIAVTAWGCSNASLLNALNAAEAGPAAPKSLTIVIGSGQTTVSWPSVAGASSYNLYWAAGATVSPSSGTKIPNAISPQVVTGLNNGTPYAFMVTSVNNYRESSAGSTADVTPGSAPAAPTISSRAPGMRQVTVNWPTIAGASSYNLYWLQGSTVSTSTGTKISGASSPQVINTLVDGTQYAFIVTSMDSFGESAASPTTNATTNLYMLYATNGASGLAAFKMNSATGALSAISGSPYTTGTNSWAATVDPSSHFLYVANSLVNTVSGYTISQNTGALNPIPGSPFAMPYGYPSELAIDPTGKFLYVACYVASGTPLVYTITPGSGALTATSGAGSIDGPNGITISPNGKFFYGVTNGNVGGPYLDAYTASPTTGALTGVGAYYCGNTPNFITIDPLTRFAYVAGYGTNNLYAYTLDPSTGVPTAVTGPFTTGGGYDEGAVDATGNFLYVTNYSASGISAYTINQTTGAPAAISGSPYATGTYPWGMTIDPTGKFVFVANTGTSGGISGFQINTITGGLSALSGSPFGTTSAFNWVAVATIVTP